MAKSNINDPYFHLRGQSLVELLIAIGVASIFISALSLSTDVAFRSSIQNKDFQSAGWFAQELLDAATLVAQSNWVGVAEVSEPSHVIASSGALDVASGVESRTVDGIVLTRSFIVSDVFRDGNGQIIQSVDPAAKDYSTKLITVTVLWAPSNNFVLSRYITRYRNSFSLQTDWIGGATKSAQPILFGDPVLDPAKNKFYRKNGVFDFSGGSIKLK